MATLENISMVQAFEEDINGKCSTVAELVHDKQASTRLFSPTTKNVLNEISSSIGGNDSSTQPSSMKRRLDFKLNSPETAASDLPMAANDKDPELIITCEVIAQTKQQGCHVVVKVEKDPDSTPGLAVGAALLLESPVKKSKKKDTMN